MYDAGGGGGVAGVAVVVEGLDRERGRRRLGRGGGTLRGVERILPLAVA